MPAANPPLIGERTTSARNPRAMMPCSMRSAEPSPDALSTTITRVWASS
jgi:hypothetical protein